MVGSAHVRGDEESLILREYLRLPVTVEGIGSIHKSVCDGASTRQEQCTAFVLAIARLDSCAVRKPVTAAGLDSAAVPTYGVSHEEALIRISVQVLVVDEEVLPSEVLGETFGAHGFHAQIHVGQER